MTRNERFVKALERLSEAVDEVNDLWPEAYPDCEKASDGYPEGLDNFAEMPDRFRLWAKTAKRALAGKE